MTDVFKKGKVANQKWEADSEKTGQKEVFKSSVLPCDYVTNKGNEIWLNKLHTDEATSLKSDTSLWENEIASMDVLSQTVKRKKQKAEEKSAEMQTVEESTFKTGITPKNITCVLKEEISPTQFDNDSFQEYKLPNIEKNTIVEEDRCVMKEILPPSSKQGHNIQTSETPTFEFAEATTKKEKESVNDIGLKKDAFSSEEMQKNVIYTLSPQEFVTHLQEMEIMAKNKKNVQLETKISVNMEDSKREQDKLLKDSEIQKPDRTKSKVEESKVERQELSGKGDVLKLNTLKKDDLPNKEKQKGLVINRISPRELGTYSMEGELVTEKEKNIQVQAEFNIETDDTQQVQDIFVEANEIHISFEGIENIKKTATEILHSCKQEENVQKQDKGALELIEGISVEKQQISIKGDTPKESAIKKGISSKKKMIEPDFRGKELQDQEPNKDSVQFFKRKTSFSRDGTFEGIMEDSFII